MANFEVLETYNSEIEKLEPTTPGHADVFNAIFQQLINNDAFIKKSGRTATYNYSKPFK